MANMAQKPEVKLVSTKDPYEEPKVPKKMCAVQPYFLACQVVAFSRSDTEGLSFAANK